MSPQRTQLLNVVPWTGGVVTSIDETLLPPTALTRADHIIMAERASKKVRDGIEWSWDDASNAAINIIGGADFWYGTATKSQIAVACASSGAIFSYTAGTSGGARTTRTDASPWTTPTRVSIVTLNNLLIMAANGASNSPKKWDGSAGTVSALGGTPPAGDFMCVHLGRLWMNDASNLDRVHYSTTANPEEWNGTGDSGGFDIGVGDGDPDGITGLTSFGGNLYVFKRTKVYEVSGGHPEEMTVKLISSGIGCISHNTIATVGQQDVFFLSERGVHSLVTTAQGETNTESFISRDIQRTFNDRWSRTRLKFSHGVWVPNLNSYAISCTETSDIDTSSSSWSTLSTGTALSTSYQNSVWFYNVEYKAWYRWPGISAQSMWVANDTDMKRIYFGTHTGRVAKYGHGTVYDVAHGGSTNLTIVARVASGAINPTGNPSAYVGFKRLGAHYRASGTYTLNGTISIDNYPSQTVVFTGTGSDLLGSTFILGTSVLGSGAIAAPTTYTIDGYGRAAKIEFVQSSTAGAVELMGYVIEFEPAETKQEVET